MLIARYNGYAFLKRLRDDLPIEGIFMVKRQVKEAESMIGSVRQNANCHVVESSAGLDSRNVQLTLCMLDRYL